LSSGDGALQELSEIVGGEIEAGGFHVVAFATDLYHADDAIAAENRRADDFLDDFRGFGASLTPSKVLACLREVKSLMISGRLSRVVRAASADLLERGMKPTFLSTSGTTKC
jgi:hypothetical protein